MSEQEIIDNAFSGCGPWILATVFLSIGLLIDWIDRRNCKECKLRRRREREWDEE